MSYKKSTIISTKSDKPRAKDSAHYVSNKDLYNAIVDWYQKIDYAKNEGKPEPIMPTTVARGIMQICYNLAKKSNWISNSKIKDEMIGDAIEDCIRRAKGFNIHHVNANGTKTENPFSYFTQTAYYAFLRTIRDEKEIDYVKQKSVLNAIANNNLFDLMENEEKEEFVQSVDYNQENVEKFVNEFEKTVFKKSLAVDECAGHAGKRRKITKNEELSGFF